MTCARLALDVRAAAEALHGDEPYLAISLVAAARALEVDGRTELGDKVLGIVAEMRARADGVYFLSENGVAHHSPSLDMAMAAYAQRLQEAVEEAAGQAGRP